LLGLGLAPISTHRCAGKSGHSATHPPSLTPHYDFHFASMTEMANDHQEALPSSVGV
jgi:hypothetical protein